MLTLGNQTLVDGTGQHRDAVPADLVAEVLTGDADDTRTGRTQDIRIQAVPLLRRDTRGDRAQCRHKTDASTSVLSRMGEGSRHHGQQPRPRAVTTKVLNLQNLRGQTLLFRCMETGLVTTAPPLTR